VSVTLALVLCGWQDRVVVEAAVAIQNLSMLSGNEAPIVQAGAIRGLVPLLSSEDPAVQDAATGALANLSSFSDHDARIVQAGALPALANLVLSPHVVSFRLIPQVGRHL
jgi:hypothetical protein